MIPDSTREEMLERLVREIFALTDPPTDAAKFLRLGSAMSENRWWKRAKAILDGGPERKLTIEYLRSYGTNHVLARDMADRIERGEHLERRAT